MSKTTTIKIYDVIIEAKKYRTMSAAQNNIDKTGSKLVYSRSGEYYVSSLSKEVEEKLKYLL